MEGERERELAALARFALRPDLPAVSFHDASGDIKAEAQSSPIILPELPEPLENGLEHVVGDAGTCVADGKTKFVCGADAFNSNGAALRRELDRVRDEIGQHLEHSIAIEFGQQGPLGHLGPKGMPFATAVA